MRMAQRGETVASLFRTANLFLGMRCRRCARRTPLDLADLPVHPRDRREVVRLPVVCRCGAAAIDWFVLETADEAAVFVRGLTVSPPIGAVGDASSGD